MEYDDNEVKGFLEERSENELLADLATLNRLCAEQNLNVHPVASENRTLRLYTQRQLLARGYTMPQLRSV